MRSKGTREHRSGCLVQISHQQRCSETEVLSALFTYHPTKHKSVLCQQSHSKSSKLSPDTIESKKPNIVPTSPPTSSFIDILAIASGMLFFTFDQTSRAQLCLQESTLETLLTSISQSRNPKTDHRKCSSSKTLRIY